MPCSPRHLTSVVVTEPLVELVIFYMAPTLSDLVFPETAMLHQMRLNALPGHSREPAAAVVVGWPRCLGELRPFRRFLSTWILLAAQGWLCAFIHGSGLSICVCDCVTVNTYCEGFSALRTKSEVQTMIGSNELCTVRT